MSLRLIAAHDHQIGTDDRGVANDPIEISVDFTVGAVSIELVSDHPRHSGNDSLVQTKRGWTHRKRYPIDQFPVTFPVLVIIERIVRQISWRDAHTSDYNSDIEVHTVELLMMPAWDQAGNKWDWLPACHAGIDRLEAYPTFRIRQ